MNGIIPLYKERGMTSHDCVNRLRKILHQKKVGHSGTLDPSVDGVLPICVGSATKVVDYLLTHRKVYRGSVTLGFSTETEDLDGAKVARKVLTEPVTDETIDAVLQTLTGDLQQTPPMYSAVKVNGRKLYEYARKHQTVERPVRTIHVTRFDRLAPSTFDTDAGTQTFTFEVECSKGTYVRTLAVQAGEALGIPSVMSTLTRIESGGFKLDETLSLDQIQDAVDRDDLSFLQPLDRALDDYPEITLTTPLWRGVQNGVWLLQREVNSDAPIVALRYDNEIKALYKLVDHKYKPLKMFSTK
ncbi:tRNA pseudouridine(55) synthase TruB [Secundilactobacillus collinoides]|uniref:tRNA pseudouridine synthase B n=1 Tax=Secundilactobacillus collinoides DSM 20515 = JCM 1123 TaxID=1423733 RepID=A0A0R2BLB3_SECCO|nr:tRNA pseudouridine(55) synthase TruB [Secundilactobacillus collinoides]KRM76566.1 tRNA pseudouridine synthase B [Secundilactobacillus collinoides DSM 20515 = JCM 1123]